jgi:precorrin-3B C17-methyltransferase
MCFNGRKENIIINPKTSNKQSDNRRRKGKLSIVGLGPGELSLLSIKARNVIKKSDVIVGYKGYLELIKDLIAGKEVAAFSMKQEIKRARFAIEKTLSGKNVCIVSSGDPGVYGMSAAVFEAMDQESGNITIEVIPGISAINSCASLLGAPISHDCAIISLSDLLTDGNLIRKRIALLAEGDFIITLYNPKSKKRVDLIKEAKEILLKHKSQKTPVGIVF